MNRQGKVFLVVCVSVVFCAIAFADESLSVLSVMSERPGGIRPSDMTKHYLDQQAQKAFEKWKDQYEQLKTAEQIAQYQKRLREKFVEAIGDLPQRTPLNAQVTGVVKRQGYRVEKIIFESKPRHHVTGLLFLPESKEHKQPWPGVIVPCGHARNAKTHEPYQTMGALLALNGMAALVFDPIDQGERFQWFDDKGQAPFVHVYGHMMSGVGCILLGRNTARFEIWDGMRAIDYLQSRPEIDPKRIGCTGCSGGGTQTSYLMALDERIVAAAPSCYITSFERLLATIGPQDVEQNIHGQLVFGMDHTDYILMRAPKPTLICAATKDFFDIEGTWDTFRYAKRLYTQMDFAERVDLLENDEKHNYNRVQREGVVRWMSRWLLKKDEPIGEPDIELLSEEESYCTPAGKVLLLEGERSTYDLNRDYEKQLASGRKKLWATMEQTELLDDIRKIAGIRKLAELSEPNAQKLEVIDRDGYRIEKIVLECEEGIYLPALMFIGEQTPPQGAIVYVHEDGKAADARVGGPIEKLVKAGQVVLAVDLRGLGETRQVSKKYLGPHFGSYTQDVLRAYLLGRSYVGMRAEDILVCARWLAQNQKAGSPGSISLVSVGSVGVPALHAAAVQTELFSSVKLKRSLVSWSNVIKSGLSYDQLVNAVHGALAVYDFDDLAKVLGEKLTVQEPLDALGRQIGSVQ